MKFFETQGSGRRRGDRSKEKAKEREESGGIQQSKQREGESKRKGEIQEERNKETSLGRQQIPPPGRSRRAPRETHTQCSPGPVGLCICAAPRDRPPARPAPPPPPPPPHGPASQKPDCVYCACAKPTVSLPPPPSFPRPPKLHANRHPEAPRDLRLVYMRAPS